MEERHNHNTYESSTTTDVEEGLPSVRVLEARVVEPAEDDEEGEWLAEALISANQQPVYHSNCVVEHN
jgi:hypothetical protein